MRNKIIFVIALTFVLVGALLYFFTEPKELSALPEEVEVVHKEISVYVSGQVKTPAVITFEDDTNLKVVDAVNAAGGLNEFADTSNINLAEPLYNGQHIHIPTKKIMIRETPTATKNISSSGDLININTADETELQKIRGVGPAIAKRIIDFREQNGKFQTIEDIKKVRGIGEKTFAKFKDFITVK